MEKQKQTIFRVSKDKENPYVIINRTMLNDEMLSWKAKGILSYLLSMPDDWQVYESEIQKHSSDGIDSLSNGIKELIKAGYIVRNRKRNEKGHLKGYEYVIYEVSTKSGLSKNGLPKNGLSKIGESKPTNNDLTNNDLTNKESVPPKKAPRKKYGEYQHILLTEAQHTKLIKDYSKQVIDNMIQKMDEWIQLHGKTYKDYNLALRKWLREDKTEQPKAPVYKDLGAE